jgi:hypothetical protein
LVPIAGENGGQFPGNAKIVRIQAGIATNPANFYSGRGCT